MGALYGRDYALGPGEVLERVHRLVVGDGDVLGPVQRFQISVLRTYPGVIQTGRYGIHGRDLPVGVLAEQGFHAVEDARGAFGHGGGMLPRVHPLPGGLASDHLHVPVVDERVEQPDGVAPATDARQKVIGDPALLGDHLLPDLASDDALEFADHLRERLRTHDGADDVVGVVDPAGPLAERLVHGVLEDARSFFDGMDLGAEELHPVDVQGLPLDVVDPHEHLALQSEVRRQRRGGDAVLAGPRLGDDAGLAHPLRQEALADDVVDLVGPGVVQVLPLEVYPGATQVLGHPVRVVEHGRASGVLVVHPVDLGHETGILDRIVVRAVQLDHRVHQGLGDVAASVLPVHAFVCHVHGEGWTLYELSVH